MSFKKCKVVMLSTNEKADNLLALIKIDNKGLNENITRLVLHKNSSVITGDYQHLYITFDEKIRQGDWYINLNTKKIDICNYHDESISINKFANNYCIKIIATTDKSLGLPQPSQQFIEKYIEEYNRGNIIADVLVEYEVDYKINCNIPVKKCRNHMINTIDCEGCTKSENKIKINCRDNTITIKKIKDSWNREEVIKVLDKLYSDFDMMSQEFYNNWIEQNL